jgi:hypothetical protein
VEERFALSIIRSLGLRNKLQLAAYFLDVVLCVVSHYITLLG